MATPKRKKKESKDAQTPTTTFDSDGFVRTAIRLKKLGECGSIDVLDHEGRRLAQLNLYVVEDGETFMCDVIDVDERFKNRRAIIFRHQDSDPEPDVQITDSLGKVRRVTVNNVTHLVASHFTNKDD